MISYGGIYLREATPQLASWLMKAMPPQEAFGFYRPRWLGDPSLNPRAHFNWFLSRPVKVNSFFNPWGASRWGTGYFLVDADALADIRALAYASDGYVALPLVMDDDDDRVLTTDLFMLPAVPLTMAPLSATDVATKLYLLTLVDERFFWWERAATISVTEETTTWVQMYSAIATALDVTITTDSISANYLYPSVGLAKKYQHLPLLLDWVAASVGQRIVRTLAGAIVARSATAAAALAAAQVDEYVKLAGGSLDLGVA
jgi:hypothetical protein